MNVPTWFPLLIVGVFAVVAGIVHLDRQRSRVVNLLTLTLLLTGISFHLMAHGPAGLLKSIGGASLGFASILLFYLIGATKAGDVKFMAAAGAWLGISESIYVLGVAAVLAVAYSSLLAIWQGGLRCVIVKLEILGLQLVVIARHLIGSEHFAGLMEPGDRPRRTPFVIMVAAAVLVLALWEDPPRWLLAW